MKFFAGTVYGLRSWGFWAAVPWRGKRDYYLDLGRWYVAVTI